MSRLNPKIIVVGVAALAIAGGGAFAAMNVLGKGKEGDGATPTVQVETSNAANASTSSASGNEAKPRIVQALNEDKPSNGVVSVRTAHRADGDDENEKAPHAISANQSDGGTIRISHSSASEGELVSLDVVPAEGFALSGFHVAGASGEPVRMEADGRSFIMPNFDVVVSAEFAENRKDEDKSNPPDSQLEFRSEEHQDDSGDSSSSNDARSSFVVRGVSEGNGRVLPERPSYAPGENVVLHVEWAVGVYPPTISATTASGRGLDLHEKSAQSNRHYIYDMTMPAEDVNINAFFAAASAHTVTLHGDAQGGVKAFDSHNTSYSGQEIRLSSNLPAGYGFDRWEVISPAWLSVSTEGDSRTPICVFTMPDEDVYIKVHFSRR